MIINIGLVGESYAHEPIERPIRSYELLSDVSATWNKDKMVNTFLLKMTPLAPILSRSVSSDASSGFLPH